MAYQPEIVQYDAGIYQLENIDPVDGGVGAVSNKPLLSLANRTAYLYQHVNNLESGATIPPGIAVVNSQAFTGTPTVPTPALGDSSLKISNTSFVQGTVNGLAPVNVAGGSNVTLTSVQAGNSILVFTGALTANIAVIVPASSKTMIVENLTSGAFSLTVKTASGTGVAVTQGKTQELFCDGTNVLLSSSDFVNVALTGTPTAPTPPIGDNSTKISTTAFVQQNGRNVAGVIPLSAATTLTNANVANEHTLGGSTTYVVKVPLSTGVPVGGTLLFRSNAAVPITLQTQGADIFAMGSQSPTAVSVGPGDTLELVSSGAGAWLLANGSSGLPFSGLFASSLGSNGYQKLPSGLIIQWGRLNNTANATSTGTFPVAFPTAVLSVVLTGQQGAGNTQAYAVLNTYNTSSFTWNAFFGTGGSAPTLGNTNGNVQGNFLAIGY
ncbi:hypothetical protein PQR64_33900 [Paraburkholderia phytofirmans]|uniref:gp53-like domain-containing protein n=1 Tax=Paraburkholderia phytofirmans TaxID=261302 RepID=UPI0038BDC889